MEWTNSIVISTAAGVAVAWPPYLVQGRHAAGHGTPRHYGRLDRADGHPGHHSLSNVPNGELQAIGQPSKSDS